MRNEFLQKEKRGNVCLFANDKATVHAKWVEVETRPLQGGGKPVTRRLLRHNAIAAWETMQKSGGWKQCRWDGEEGHSAHPIHFLPSLNAKVKAKLTATNEIGSF